MIQKQTWKDEIRILITDEEKILAQFKYPFHYMLVIFSAKLML